MNRNKLPRWEKVLQRTFPPFAETTSGYFEFHGFSIGPMDWIREREILIKYQNPQMYMIQDPAAYYITNIKSLLNKAHPNFEKAIDKINSDVYKGVRVSPGKTLKDLQKLNELHLYLYGVMLIAFDVLIDIGSKIDKTIKNNDLDFPLYLATPIKKTGIQREKEAMSAARINITKSKLNRLVADFGYIHQDYLGQPWGVKDYQKACKDKIILKSNKSKSYNISQYSPNEQYLIRIFRKFIYMYEEGRNAMVRACWSMKETLKTLGYDPDKMLYMTRTEVELFSQNKGPYISDRLLRKRKEAFAIYFEAGKYYEFTGNQEVRRFIKSQKIEHFWNQKIKSEITLKGSIAYKGKVKGRVRLVFTQTDANRVQRGEIFIAPMTQVEFLSGLRKCGAIVTDEGGG